MLQLKPSKTAIVSMCLARVLLIVNSLKGNLEEETREEIVRVEIEAEIKGMIDLGIGLIDTQSYIK